MTDDEPTPLLSSRRIQQQLDEIATWQASSARANELAATRAQISEVQQAILQRPPTSPDEIAILLMLHGKLEILTESLTFLEDVRADLQTKLLKAEELETQSSTTSIPTQQ